MGEGEDQEARETGAEERDADEERCRHEQRVEDARQEVRRRADAEAAQGVHLVAVGAAPDVGGHRRAAAGREEHRRQHRHDRPVEHEAEGLEHLVGDERLRVEAERQELEGEVRRHETRDEARAGEVKPRRGREDEPQVVDEEAPAPADSPPEGEQVKHAHQGALEGLPRAFQEAAAPGDEPADRGPPLHLLLLVEAMRSGKVRRQVVQVVPVELPERPLVRVEQVDLVGDSRQVLVVVRDDDRRLRVSLAGLADPAGHLGRVGRVEPRRRLVVDDDRRIVGEGTGHGEPLLLPAAQGTHRGARRDVELPEEVPGSIRSLRRRRAGAPRGRVVQGELDVLAARELVEEREVLEDEPQLGPAGASRQDLPAGDVDAAARIHRVGVLESREDLDEDRLAGAARPDDERHFAGGEIRLGPFEERAARHLHPEVPDADPRRFLSVHRSPRRRPRRRPRGGAPRRSRGRRRASGRPCGRSAP